MRLERPPALNDDPRYIATLVEVIEERAAPWLLGTGVNRVVVVGGGIAGLAAALRLERTSPDTEVVLVESRPRLGGTILTEQVGGFVIEGGPDSFLARKPRGIGLCEELGLGRRADRARVARHRRTYVRLGGELHPLPEGLTGMIPTRLEALASSGILSPEGLVRFALEPRGAGEPGGRRRVDRRLRLAPDGPRGLRAPGRAADERHLRRRR